MKKKNELRTKIVRNKTANNFDKKLKLLGSNYDYNAVYILNFRLITTILLFLIVLLLKPFSIIWAPIISAIYYYGFKYLFLDYRIKRRETRLDIDAFYYFEMLTIILESGKNLKEALEITTNTLNSELSIEFRKTLNEVRIGKKLGNALSDMKNRIPNESINNIIITLIQSNMYGTNLIESLNNQVEYLREKRLLEIKGKIMKLPVKLTLASIIFFIPIILLIVFGSAIIRWIG